MGQMLAVCLSCHVTAPNSGTNKLKLMFKKDLILSKVKTSSKRSNLSKCFTKIILRSSVDRRRFERAVV